MTDKKLTYTIDSADVDSALTNFPAVIQIQPNQRPDSVDDDFTGTDGDAPNPLLWDIVESGNGGTADLLSNTLRLDIPSHAGSDDQVQANTKYTLQGDFDIQVDYTEITNALPATGSSYPAQLLLVNADISYYVFLFTTSDSSSKKTGYNASSGDSYTTISTHSTASKFRFTRVSGVVTGFYWSGSQWEWDGSTSGKVFATNNTENLYIWIRAIAGESRQIVTDFDNFTVNSGTIVWPDTSLPGSGITGFDTSEVFDELTGGRDQYTKLLIHADEADESTTIADSSDSAHTITAVGDAAVKDFDADGNEIVNYSGFFNGTDAYLTVPDSTDWDMGATFSIECMVNVSSLASSVTIAGSSVDDNSRWLFFILTTGAIRFLVISSGTVRYVDSSTGGIEADKWYHLRYVQDGTTAYIFINGVAQSLTYSGTLLGITASTNNIEVGVRYASSAWGLYFNGYITGLAIHDAVLSTTAFTPPLTIAEMTNDANTVLFLDFTELDQGELPATIVDSSASAHTVTNVSSKVSGCTFWWSGAVEFDGTGDYLTVPDSTDFNFGSNDFTIDFWVRKTRNGTNERICGQYETASPNYRSGEVMFLSSNVLRATFGHSAGSVNVDTVNTIADFAWHHIVYARDGNTIRLFVDGVPDGTADVTGLTQSDCPSVYAVGRLGEYTSDLFKGDIAEFSISNGIARHTSAFTPPTKPYRGSWERIKITDSDDNQLFAEIENPDDWVNQKATIHVKVPTISSSADTVLTLDYNETNADNSVQSITDLSDDFTGTDGDAPNPLLWDVVNNSVSGSALISSNKLRITIPSTSADESISAKTMFGIEGDFDVQVDYAHVSDDPPSSSASWLPQFSIYTDEGYFTLFIMLGAGGTKQFASQSSSDAFTTISSSYTGSKFRWVRVGSVVTGYYWNGSQWEWAGSTAGKVFSRSDNSNVKSIRLYVTADFNSGAVMDFDNFIVNSADVISGYIGATQSIAGGSVNRDSAEVVLHTYQDPSGGSGCILDSVSPFADGTPQGSMTSTDLVVGGFYDFDGTDDHIDLSDTIDFGRSDTLEFYYKSDSATGTFQLISSTGAYSDGRIGLSATTLSFGGSSPTSFTHGVTITDGHYYRITRDGDTCKLYVDGALVDTTTNLTDTSTFEFNCIGGGGGAHWATAWVYANGIFGKIRHYSEVLTDADVEFLSITDSLFTVTAFTDRAFLRAILDQGYDLSGWLLRAILDQPYRITAAQRAILDQVYGIRMAAIFNQPYGEKTTLRKVLNQYYGERYTHRRIFDQPFSESRVMRSVLKQTYRLVPGLRQVHNQPYAVREQQLRKVHNQLFDLLAKDVHRAVLNQSFSLLSAGTSSAETTTIAVIAIPDSTTPPGTTPVPGTTPLPELDMSSLRISIKFNLDEYSGQCTIVLSNETAWEQLVPLSKITIPYNGTDYTFVVVSRQQQVSNTQLEYTLNCRSEAVLLDFPHASAIEDEEDVYGTSSEIVSRLAARVGLSITWNMPVDPPQSTSTIQVKGESPLSAIRALANPLGGKIKSLPSGAISIVPSYVENTHQYPAISTSYTFTTEVPIQSLTYEASGDRDGYNIFTISNETISDAYDLRTEKVTSKEYYIDAFKVPWSDKTVALTTSELTNVTISDPPLLHTEVIEEEVDIENGEGTTTKPMYGQPTLDYGSRVDLGVVATWEESGVFKPTVLGSSLATITYTTKCWRWTAKGTDVEEVQFILETI